MKMPNFASRHHCGVGRLSSDAQFASYFSAKAAVAHSATAVNVNPNLVFMSLPVTILSSFYPPTPLT